MSLPWLGLPQDPHTTGHKVPTASFFDSFAVPILPAASQLRLRNLRQLARLPLLATENRYFGVKRPRKSLCWRNRPFQKCV